VSDTPRTEAEVNRQKCWSDDLITIDANFACRLERELNAANDRIKRLEEVVESAWGVIANVSGGNWAEQRPDWREVAIRWRDERFHPVWKSVAERKVKEAKL
jgi:hypothetical protein